MPLQKLSPSNRASLCYYRSCTKQRIPIRVLSNLFITTKKTKGWLIKLDWELISKILFHKNKD